MQCACSVKATRSSAPLLSSPLLQRRSRACLGWSSAPASMGPRKIKSNQSAVYLTRSLDGNVGCNGSQDVGESAIWTSPHDMELTSLVALAQSSITLAVVLCTTPIAQYYNARRPSDSVNAHIEEERIDPSGLSTTVARKTHTDSTNTTQTPSCCDLASSPRHPLSASSVVQQFFLGNSYPSLVSKLHRSSSLPGEGTGEHSQPQNKSPES